MSRVGVILLVCAALSTGGCDDSPLIGRGAGVNGATFGSEGAPEFVDVTFEYLHPIFLRHKIAQGPKAALWAQRYHRRWVKWTGRIRSFTVNGVTLRQLPATSTFDVSLFINNSEQAATRARFKVGDVVTYVGRLDSYDDIWRTLYLINGSILNAPPDQQDAPF
ncbi:MAG: hypothetical protein JWN44_2616 [Myxococcales bacterium]|nr:hypothetical protein [Myxococcales bacterium]